MKLVIVGAGQFSQCFVPLFQAHPKVGEVALCDIDSERLEREAARLGVRKLHSSFEDALCSDCDAVAIFTQRWMHGPMAVRALRAGKHVYSSVPAAISLEELSELVEAVGESGRVYMLGETSLYYGARLFMKEKWDAGEMGRFVYGEGEYYHDMSHGFYRAFQHSGGEGWKRTASFPPMLYPTHSTAMVLSVTGARATDVRCLGVEDRGDDGVFDRAASRWDNDFSNQCALMRTSDGGLMRINEFRRVGLSGGRSVRGRIYGSLGSFEEHAGGAVWTSRDGKMAVQVEDAIQCGGVHDHAHWDRIRVDVALKGEFSAGFAEIHQKYRSRLPDAFRVQPNGHEGSHQFLVDDFVRSVVDGESVSCDVYDACRFNAPGIVAHASAQQGGAALEIPEFSPMNPTVSR